MNKVFLTGRLTKKPELYNTASGKAKCEFSIAISRDKETTDFITVVVWDKQAENLCKYQDKGNLIGVAGELRNDSFKKQDGSTGYKSYVLAREIEYLSSKQETKEENSDPFAEFGEEITDNFLD